jgi:glucan biosynthesis protein C
MALLAHRFGRAGSVAGYLLSPISGIFMAHLLFATTNRLLARRSARVLWLARSSFTVYLVHHPIVAALGVGLLGVSLSPAVEFVAVVLIATTLGIAAHRVVLASPVLLFLFNGVAERRTPLRPTLAGTP